MNKTNLRISMKKKNQRKGKDDKLKTLKLLSDGLISLIKEHNEPRYICINFIEEDLSIKKYIVPESEVSELDIELLTIDSGGRQHRPVGNWWVVESKIGLLAQNYVSYALGNQCIDEDGIYFDKQTYEGCKNAENGVKDYTYDEAFELIRDNVSKWGKYEMDDDVIAQNISQTFYIYYGCYGIC